MCANHLYAFVGIVFSCTKGTLDLETPIALIQEGGKLLFSPDWSPAQLDFVRQLQPMALSHWWQPNHTNWDLLQWDSDAYKNAGQLVPCNVVCLCQPCRLPEVLCSLTVAVINLCSSAALHLHLCTWCGLHLSTFPPASSYPAQLMLCSHKGPLQSVVPLQMYLIFCTRQKLDLCLSQLLLDTVPLSQGSALQFMVCHWHNGVDFNESILHVPVITSLELLLHLCRKITLQHQDLQAFKVATMHILLSTSCKVDKVPQD
jgi:hypothetical protein